MDQLVCWLVNYLVLRLDLFYTAFLKGGEEGGIDAAKQQLKQKWMSLVSGGKAALDWGVKGFSRLYESLPKFKMPSQKVAGIEIIPYAGTEFLDPKSILDPMGIKMQGILVKHF